MNRSRYIMYTFALTALVLLLAACGGTTNNPPATPGPDPTVQSGTTTASTPGSGPIVVLTPTTKPGGSIAQQTIRLADRTLVLEPVSRQPGADASSTAVSLTITVTNTSTHAIKNEAIFYQLVDAEGDAFGLQSNVTQGFYGTIAQQQSRQGTITFQVPSGAAQSLELLYRPEVTTETTLVPLNK